MVDYKVSVSTEDGVERLSTTISGGSSTIDEVEILKKGTTDSLLNEWEIIKGDITETIALDIPMLKSVTQGLIDVDEEENVTIKATSVGQKTEEDIVDASVLADYVLLSELMTKIEDYLNDDGDTGNERFNTIATKATTDNTKLATITNEEVDPTTQDNLTSYFIKINQLIIAVNELISLVDATTVDPIELLTSSNVESQEEE